MRRLIAGLAVAAIGVGLLAPAANAQTVNKFTVKTAKTRGHRVTGGFKIHGLLVVPGDSDDVLGTFEATFTGRHGDHVRAVFFFSDGKIKANGDQNHNKIPIVGGTSRWNGASGKVKITDIPHSGNVLLTFTVVQ